MSPFKFWWMRRAKWWIRRGICAIVGHRMTFAFGCGERGMVALKVCSKCGWGRKIT